MKRLLTLTTLSLVCANAFAAQPVFLPPGSNLTYGSVSNNQSILSNVTNPAAGAMVFSKEESQYRFGILSNIGAGYEVGAVDNLLNQVDSAQATLQGTQGITTTTLAGLIGSTQAQTAQNIANYLNTTYISTVNGVMATAQRDGYVKVGLGLSVPLMPIVVSHKGLGGSFVLDVNASAIGSLKFLNDNSTGVDAGYLQDPANFTVPTSASSPVNVDLSKVVKSDTSVVVQGAAVTQASLGYSRTILESEAGHFFAGGRLNYYRVGLTRTAERIINGQSADKAFKDNNNKHLVDSSAMGLDLGALWVSTNYRAGMWIDNVNQPKFKYPDIDLSAYNPSSTVYAELSKSATYTMKSQAHLEGAVYTESQNWVINVGLDANAVPDPMGYDYKWGTISAAYASDTWWIPGLRVGYRTNMAGTKLNYMTAGLTILHFNLDAAYCLDKVTFNKSDSVPINGTVPRSAMINLGFDMTF